MNVYLKKKASRLTSYTVVGLMTCSLSFSGFAQSSSRLPVAGSTEQILSDINSGSSRLIYLGEPGSSVSAPRGNPMSPEQTRALLDQIRDQENRPNRMPTLSAQEAELVLQGIRNNPDRLGGLWTGPHPATPEEAARLRDLIGNTVSHPNPGGSGTRHQLPAVGQPVELPQVSMEDIQGLVNGVRNDPAAFEGLWTGPHPASPEDAERLRDLLANTTSNPNRAGSGRANQIPAEGVAVELPHVSTEELQDFINGVRNNPSDFEGLWTGPHPVDPADAERLRELLTNTVSNPNRGGSGGQAQLPADGVPVELPYVSTEALQEFINGVRNNPADFEGLWTGPHPATPEEAARFRDLMNQSLTLVNETPGSMSVEDFMERVRNGKPVVLPQVTQEELEELLRNGDVVVQDSNGITQLSSAANADQMCHDFGETPKVFELGTDFLSTIGCNARLGPRQTAKLCMMPFVRCMKSSSIWQDLGIAGNFREPFKNVVCPVNAQTGECPSAHECLSTAVTDLQSGRDHRPRVGDRTEEVPSRSSRGRRSTGR
jgi:hypothetical protein